MKTLNNTFRFRLLKRKTHTHTQNSSVQPLEMSIISTKFDGRTKTKRTTTTKSTGLPAL